MERGLDSFLPYCLTGGDPCGVGMLTGLFQAPQLLSSDIALHPLLLIFMSQLPTVRGVDAGFQSQYSG